MNYKFSATELECLKFCTSGTAIGVTDVFNNDLFERGRKSSIELMRDIILKPHIRTTRFEQNLLKNKSEDYANAYRAICMVERIRLLYSSIGFPWPRLYNTSCDRDKEKYVTVLLQWTYLYFIGEAEKFAKFQSVSAFNKVMNVEPLESIDLPFSWCVGSMTPFGAMHRKVYRCLVRSPLERRCRLSQCFLYFKKGCPKASKSFIKESLQKHEKALTKPAPLVDTLSWKDKDQVTVVPRSAIKKRISEIVFDVFKDYVEPTKFWEPSVSASYHTKKTKGGQMSEVTFSCPGWGWRPKGNGHSSCRTISWEYSPLGDNWDFFDTGYALVKVPLDVLPSVKVTKDIEARPVALTEPLKVRIITCENSWSTYMLAGAQKSLWDCLHRHHWFSLTGRPVVASDIPVLTEGKEYISVDYSAATDNLSSEFSRLVIREICDLTGLPFDLCFDSLCHHKINYKGTIVEQTNGQLMGSILSFIVLCICNAVVLSLSVNPESFDRFSPFLVNGDDGLFMGGDREYTTWKLLSSHVGLTPSIGKVYRSSEFCVIDSELFYVNCDGLVLSCPYPNASGMMQFDARTYSKAKTPLDLKDSLKLWLSGFPDIDAKKEAESLWYSTFKELLDTDWVQTFGIDYYLPQSLGGLGLPSRLKDGRRIVSREALARARWCYHNGLPWERKPGKKLINGESYVYKKFKNPFIESSSYSKFTSTREVTESTYSALKVLGYDKPVEVVCKDGAWNFPFLNQHRGGSSLSVALLNGSQPLETSKCLVDSYVDFNKNFRQLRRDKSFQHYWDNYREISADDLSFVELVRGSRKIASWTPQIPLFDPILGKNYCKMLELVQQFRVSDECVIEPSRGVNPFDSNIIKGSLLRKVHW